MIKLGKFVGGGWWGGWLTPAIYIQLAGAGSTARWGWINNLKKKKKCFVKISGAS